MEYEAKGLQNESERMRKALKDKNDDISVFQSNQSDALYSIRDNQTKIMQSEREKQVILKELNDIAAELKSAKHLLKTKEDENRALKNDIWELNNESSRNNNELKEVQYKLQESYTKRESEKRSVSNHIRSPKRDDPSSNSEMANILEKRLENERKESDRKSKDILNLKSEIAKKNELIENQTSQNTINNIELDKLKEEIYKGMKALSNLRQNKRNLEEELTQGYSQTDAKGKIVLLQTESKELFNIIKSVIEKNAELEGEACKVSNKNDTTDQTKTGSDHNIQVDRKTLSENRD